MSPWMLTSGCKLQRFGEKYVEHEAVAHADLGVVACVGGFL